MSFITRTWGDMKKSVYDTDNNGIVDNSTKVNNIYIPGAISDILTDHDKATHDALNIDAGTLNGKTDTDLNKGEIYAPVKYSGGGSSWVQHNNHAGVEINSTGENGLIEIPLPGDFSSITSFKVFAINMGSAEINTTDTVFIISANWGNIGEQDNNHSVSGVSISPDVDQIAQYDIFTAELKNDITPITAGDTIGLSVVYDGTHDILLLGVMVRFQKS